MSVQVKATMTADEWKKQHLAECEEQERQSGRLGRMRICPGFDEHWASRVGDTEADVAVRCKACGEIYRCKEALP